MKKMILFLTALCILALTAMIPAYADDYTWDEASATQIALAGNTAAIGGSGASIQGQVVTIEASGTYVLTGTSSDVQLHIATTKDDTVRLVLNGAQMSHTSTSPIYASKVGTLVLILADGTTNVISDATTYVYADGTDEPDAAIYCQDDMTIGGSGTLTVTANYRNGITAKDDLVIDSGTIYVAAVNDGIRGRDSLTINGGTIDITAGNDGMKANNDTDTEKGTITINGGEIAIDALYDGIQAETALIINGGTFTIQSGGGAANAPATSGGEWQRGMQASSQSTTTESMKGLKAGTALDINGGTFTLDSADDALHTNGDMSITGGSMAIATGDDGAHADGSLVISGGTIHITQSYEGLEGATIAISGGNIDLVASDDGINAAGGSDGNTGMGGWGGDAFRSGGSSDYWIEISGGTLVIDAQGDGIDSNGSLTISGGEITVHGPTSGGNGALDADGTITLSGGILLAGGSSGMAELPSNISTQPSLAIFYSTAQPAGTTFTLMDANGTVLATYTAEKQSQMVLFSHPQLVLGSTYTVNNGSMQTSVTLQSAMTSVSQDGSAASGTGGFGGGGRGRP